jgi:hypothetical protein
MRFRQVVRRPDRDGGLDALFDGLVVVAKLNVPR